MCLVISVPGRVLQPPRGVHDHGLHCKVEYQLLQVSVCIMSADVVLFTKACLCAILFLYLSAVSVSGRVVQSIQLGWWQ